MCVVIPSILDVILVDAPVAVTQEKGQTGFLRFPSAVIALSLVARNIQPSLSLVDREVEFCVPKILLGIIIIHLFLRGKIPVRVTTPRFELTFQRQKVSRLPTEPPGGPTVSCAIIVPASIST